MDKNGELKKQNGIVVEKTLRKAVQLERIGNRAVHKAQEENRRRGIPNWYSINGKIVSDAEIVADDKKDK